MNKLHKLIEYYKAIRALQAARRSTFIREARALLNFRLKTGKGPGLYTLYGLFDVAPSQWPEYLDKQELDTLHKVVNNSRDAPLLDDKLKFYERCQKSNVRTPQVLAVLGPSSLDAMHAINLRTAHAFAVFVSKLAAGEYIFKTTGGSYGQGLYAVRIGNECILDLSTGKSHALQEFHAKLFGGGYSYLLQERLRPCKELIDIMPGGALGTVRIVSYLNRTGQVTIPYAFIKLPVLGQVADNFAHGETGNLLCGINVANGTMMHAFGKAGGQPFLTKHRIHPQTGIELLGRAVPRWKEITELCSSAARCFAEFRTVGWDVGVTDDGLYILEGNRSYDPDGPQITLERGIRSEISALYQT